MAKIHKVNKKSTLAFYLLQPTYYQLRLLFKTDGITRNLELFQNHFINSQKTVHSKLFLHLPLRCITIKMILNRYHGSTYHLLVTSV